MSDSTLEIAKDAYVYFYPIVQNLKTLFYTSVWPHTPSYGGSVNQFDHASKLLDWRFTAVVSPNNDTLYSQAWLDLEKQPIVLSLPTVPTLSGEKRYYSVQIVDGYTFNIKTISPRITGSWDADNYLIIGPYYKGTTDKFDKDHIIRSTSRFTFVLTRTAVYGPDDVKNVLKIQDGYILTPLQESMTGETPKLYNNGHSEALLPAFPFIDTDELKKQSPEPEVFIKYVNFITKYIEEYEYESDLYKRFRELNIGPGLIFDGQNLSKEEYRAIRAGVTTGAKKIDLAPLTESFGHRENGWIAAIKPPLFGPEEVMRGRYTTRAYAAKVGLYGANSEEAYYPITNHDIDSDPFDSTKYAYTLTFSADQVPATKEGGFWSITMYRLPERLFVRNPIDRYSIGDRTKGLVYDNGTLTLYIQKDRPDDENKVANWLPAPDPEYGGYETGLFNIIMRIYWATDEALSGPYMPPGVKKSAELPPSCEQNEHAHL